MTNELLVKALRCKTNNINDCTLCAYHNACYGGTLVEIAADALEEDEQQIARLVEDLKTREAEREVMQDTIKICEEAADRYKAQMPKRGEWIAVKDWLQIPQEDSGTYRCSACGQVMKYPWNYCPNCGARMDGAE